MGVATNILTRRLEGFVEAGLMERGEPGGPGEQEYRLTQKGMELKPVIMALTQWGDKWLLPGPVEFQTESDGRSVGVELRRKGDDAPVRVEDVVAKKKRP